MSSDLVPVESPADPAEVFSIPRPNNPLGVEEFMEFTSAQAFEAGVRRTVRCSDGYFVPSNPDGQLTPRPKANIVRTGGLSNV